MSIYTVILNDGTKLETRIKKGAHLVMVCPYHHEDTPSFLVNYENASFHCLGCDAKGDGSGIIIGHEPETKEEIIQAYWEDCKISAFEWVFQVNRCGERFWDVFLHPECTVIRKKVFKKGETPFEKPLTLIEAASQAAEHLRAVAEEENEHPDDSFEMTLARDLEEAIKIAESEQES